MEVFNLMNPKKNIKILIADDDRKLQALIKEAFDNNNTICDIFFVDNGEELIDFLRNTGKYSDKNMYPRPGIILLDLNMPKKDGYQALKEIKSDDSLKNIPIVVLAASKSKEDISATYNLGISGYITKPNTFESLAEILKITSSYWFEIVELPS